MGRWLVAVAVTVVACFAAPPEVHYAPDLAAATPATAAQVVAAAQRDLDALTAQALADVTHASVVDGHLDDTGKEAIREIERLRAAVAADAMVPLITMRFESSGVQFVPGPSFMSLYPAMAAALSIGWPCLEAVDSLAASSDSPDTSGACAMFYRGALGDQGAAAAKARMARLVASGATAEIRERFRVIGRSVASSAPPYGSRQRWTAQIETEWHDRKLPRHWRTERQRYFETDALLSALPAWLDDPAQAFRAVAALRVLATLRSVEPGPLLCARLTWADPSAKPDAPLAERYPAVAGLIAIGHPMFGSLVKRLGEARDPLARELGAEVLRRVLGGRAEARAFLLSEEVGGMDAQSVFGAFGGPPDRPLKALAESEWLKGDDPPLVVRP